ncbi:regucalcin [Cercophora newfieldiana]|uniref:Regucalcin n=1 Tax=Cercophora newfieldiana TaxID=92897 RepID=A0AA39Y4Q5_9PEZI|nr:regucalcin [Cercophora newfieldiana]
MADQEIQHWHVTKPYVDLHCALGEGPYFEKATNTLRFVDIKKKQVHTVSLSEGPDSLRTVQLDVPVTVTANIQGRAPQDQILVGLKYGIAVLDRKTGKYEYLTKFAEQDNARLRSNDGAADPHGRFWLGTMTDFGLGDFEPEGSLFRFDHGKSVASTRDRLTIPNSVGWSPDAKTMYFTHSTARQVFAFDYDPVTGGLSNERLFYQHHGTGEPDGFRVDVEGNIWHAVYGEGKVLKISKEGKLVGEVNLPTRNITCPEFVGTELLITCADDDEGEGESKRFGGALWRVDVGVEGLGHYEFKLA